MPYKEHDLQLVLKERSYNWLGPTKVYVGFVHHRLDHGDDLI